MDIDFTCPQYIPFHFVEQLDLFLDSRPLLSLTPYTHSVAGTAQVIPNWPTHILCLSQRSCLLQELLWVELCGGGISGTVGCVLLGTDYVSLQSWALPLSHTHSIGHRSFTEVSTFLKANQNFSKATRMLIRRQYSGTQRGKIICQLRQTVTSNLRQHGTRKKVCGTSLIVLRRQQAF